MGGVKSRRRSSVGAIFNLGADKAPRRSGGRAATRRVGVLRRLCSSRLAARSRARERGRRSSGGEQLGGGASRRAGGRTPLKLELAINFESERIGSARTLSAPNCRGARARTRAALADFARPKSNSNQRGQRAARGEEGGARGEGRGAPFFSRRRRWRPPRANWRPRAGGQQAPV